MSARLCLLPGGRNLAWREVGEGPVILLLHGWTMTGAVFTELAGLLQSRFRVVMPDLPGHGKSTPLSKPSLEVMADDLVHFLRQMKFDPHLLCGWSLGGMVAMTAVAAGGAAPQGLVLLSTTPCFTAVGDWPYGLPAVEVKLLKRNLQRSYLSTLGRFFSRMFEGEPLGAERLREIRRFAVYGQTLPEPATALELLDIFATQDQRSILPTMHCPVLVLHGSEDRITPVGAGRYLARTLPQARLQEYQGVGHAPFLSCPEQVADAIGRFA